MGIYAGDLERPAYESTITLLDVYNQFTMENPDYEIDVKICAYSEQEYDEIKDIF